MLRRFIRFTDAKGLLNRYGVRETKSIRFINASPTRATSRDWNSKSRACRAFKAKKKNTAVAKLSSKVVVSVNIESKKKKQHRYKFRSERGSPCSDDKSETPTRLIPTEFFTTQLRVYKETKKYPLAGHKDTRARLAEKTPWEKSQETKGKESERERATGAQQRRENVGRKKKGIDRNRWRRSSSTRSFIFRARRFKDERDAAAAAAASEWNEMTEEREREKRGEVWGLGDIALARRYTCTELRKARFFR